MKISKSKFNGGFSLKNTILSDQCPSDTWERNERYSSYILGFDNKFHKVVAWEDEKYLYYESNKKLDKELLYLFWYDYPLLDFYNKFKRDKYISKIIKKCKGLRPMRDLDIKYRIIESIITQNNNLKRIRKLDKILREKYGNGFTYNINKLSKAKIEDLKEIGLGYRAEYILEVANAMKDKYFIKKLREMKTEDARKFLMSIKGIGPKVADIILGFGIGKRDVFPMDVWLKRAIKREYFNNRKVSDNKLRGFALDYFGEHAQVAHVYIYCYERRWNNG